MLKFRGGSSRSRGLEGRLLLCDSLLVESNIILFVSEISFSLSALSFEGLGSLTATVLVESFTLKIAGGSSNSFKGAIQVSYASYPETASPTCPIFIPRLKTELSLVSN